MPLINPLATILQRDRFMVLDGALATELEARGCNLVDSLWSAKVLLEQPEIITEVHLDYFRAGAQVATTASYQATPDGFATRGIGPQQAHALIVKSVALASLARSARLKEAPDAGPLLVAGSVGPFGAYLADGSEYRGDYQRSATQFQDFHRPRIAALVEAGADLLACETLPSFAELQALTELLGREFPATGAWFSFTLRDAQHISDGTPLAQVADWLNACPQALAVGINCVPLELTSAALHHLAALTPLPLVVYPNSGEAYDPERKIWHREGHACHSLDEYLDDWLNAGARLIGGCCRTTPADIASLAARSAR